MKKIIAIALMLCLLLCCVPAMAEGKLDCTDSRVVRNLENKQITVYIQVTNTGDTPAGLDYCTITLYDANKAQLEQSKTYSLYPGYLLPGEIGYIAYTFYGMDEQVAKAVSSYNIDVLTELDYLYPIKSVPHTISYVVEEGSYSTYHYAELNIINDSDEVLWQPEYVYVVRSTEGKILTIVSSRCYDVGIPAGANIFYRSSIGTSAVEDWAAAGHQIGSIEAFTYIELD